MRANEKGGPEGPPFLVWFWHLTVPPNGQRE